MLKLCQHLKEKEIERMEISYFLLNVLTLRKVGRLHSVTSASSCIEQVLLMALAASLASPFLPWDLLIVCLSPRLSCSLSSNVFPPEWLL